MIPRYLISFNTDTLPYLECDVLVAGSGVAGLSTALRLSRFCDVLLVTKSDLQVSTTRVAQGRHRSGDRRARLEAGAYQ